MGREREGHRERIAGAGESVAGAPGKRSLVASRYPALGKLLQAQAGDREPTIHDAATAAVEHKGSGSALETDVAARVGAHLGADFSDVRVHQDPLSQQATAAMGALGQEVSRALAFAISVVTFAACRDRPIPTQALLARDAAVMVDAATLDASVDIEPPMQIARPSPPWPHHRGPSCAGYIAVSTVDLTSCAVCNDGAVYCWGDPSSRVLPGSPSHRGRDVSRIDGIADAIAIAVSFRLVCTLDRSGRVRCWDDRGSVGSDVARDARPRPLVPAIVDIPLPGMAVAVEVGEQHACALLATKEMVCWGRNDWLQIGVDVVGQGPGGTVAPTVIPQLRAIRIAAANNVTCAVDTQHRAWCWGWNGSGATGTGDRRHRIGPVRVGRFDDVIDIATDGGQGCLRRANQEVWCWGQPDNLEQATPPPALRPRVPPGGSLAIDGDVVSVVGADGLVTTAAGSALPGRIPDLPPVRALSSRDGGTCAILQNGELRCWGDNPQGDLVIAVEPGSP